MLRCKVSANSKRGRQLITMYGDEWEVLHTWRPMPCFDNREGLHIASLKGGHTRNVAMIDDKVFNIYYIMEQS